MLVLLRFSCTFLWARVHQYADRHGAADTPPETDGRKGDCGHAAASPAGRIDANGGDSPRQRPRILCREAESIRVGHTLRISG